MKLYMRRLPMHHGVNVRDLGGYPIHDTSMSAWNRCLRSDDPYAFDAHDYRLLKELKVDRILDLRSLEEAKLSVCTCEQYGIPHISLPFLKQEISSANLDDEAMQKFLDSMKLDYVKMLQEAVEVLPKILQEIADALAKGNCVLFHCSAGKDRTGIVACILLDLIGVSRNDILADYEVSATYNREGINRRVGNAMKIPEVKALFESRIETMEPLLDFLHTTSCEDWLRVIGVPIQTIKTIQKELTVSI